MFTVACICVLRLQQPVVGATSDAAAPPESAGAASGQRTRTHSAAGDVAEASGPTGAAIMEKHFTSSGKSIQLSWSFCSPLRQLSISSAANVSVGAVVLRTHTLIVPVFPIRTASAKSMVGTDGDTAGI